MLVTRGARLLIQLTVNLEQMPTACVLHHAEKTHRTSVVYSPMALSRGLSRGFGFRSLASGSSDASISVAASASGQVRYAATWLQTVTASLVVMLLCSSKLAGVAAPCPSFTASLHLTQQGQVS